LGKEKDLEASCSQSGLHTEFKDSLGNVSEILFLKAMDIEVLRVLLKLLASAGWKCLSYSIHKGNML
jgi:hypothetical protein